MSAGTFAVAAPLTPSIAARTGGTVALTLTRTGGADGAVTLTFDCRNDPGTGQDHYWTARAPRDFTCPPGNSTFPATVVFADGETEKAVEVAVVKNTGQPFTRTVPFRIAAVSGGAIAPPTIRPMEGFANENGDAPPAHAQIDLPRSVVPICADQFKARQDATTYPIEEHAMDAGDGWVVLNGDWVNHDGGLFGAIVGSGAVATSGRGHADVRAQIVIELGLRAPQRHGLVLRHAYPDDGSCLLLAFDVPAGAEPYQPFVALWEVGADGVVSGAPVGRRKIDWVPGDRFALGAELDGAAVRALIDGVPVAAFRSGHNRGRSYYGVYSGGGAETFDDFFAVPPPVALRCVVCRTLALAPALARGIPLRAALARALPLTEVL